MDLNLEMHQRRTGPVVDAGCVRWSARVPAIGSIASKRLNKCIKSRSQIAGRAAIYLFAFALRTENKADKYGVLLCVT